MDELSEEFESFKTDEEDLEEVLNEYDLGESLEAEFNAIDAEFNQLQIIYTSLLKAREFLKNA
jgi:hypothetical protein